MSNISREKLSEEVTKVLEAFPYRGISATEITAMVNQVRPKESGRVRTAPVLAMLATMEANGKVSRQNVDLVSVWTYNGPPAPGEEELYVVCGVCGEAFDDLSYARAHEMTADHPEGCGDPDYHILTQAEAF